MDIIKLQTDLHRCGLDNDVVIKGDDLQALRDRWQSYNHLASFVLEVAKGNFDEEAFKEAKTLYSEMTEGVRAGLFPGGDLPGEIITPLAKLVGVEKRARQMLKMHPKSDWDS